jgi:hypothetical protein
MNFTLLAFTSGTGEAMICAIIMKSKKHVLENPIRWKLAIDVTKEVHTRETMFKHTIIM